jgi:hypothetical protein
MKSGGPVAAGRPIESFCRAEESWDNWNEDSEDMVVGSMVSLMADAHQPRRKSGGANQRRAWWAGEGGIRAKQNWRADGGERIMAAENSLNTSAKAKSIHEKQLIINNEISNEE